MDSEDDYRHWPSLKASDPNIEGYLRAHPNDEVTVFGDASFADFSIAFLFRICLEPASEWEHGPRG